MGEDTRTGGPAMSTAHATDGTARDPDEIREEIEQTRAELGDTVAALAHKTDVKAQARRRIDHAKASVADRKNDLAEKARTATPPSAASASQTVRENPLPLVLTGAFAVGFIAGRISSR